MVQSCSSKDQDDKTKQEDHTFRNPLLQSGPDPWAIFHDGYYYFTTTRGSKLVLWKTRDITDLGNAEKKDVWIPPQGEIYSHALWAPEIHFLEGKWYFYFAADDGDHMNHRMFVLENPSADPMEGEFIFRGKIVTDQDDNWAIDGSVFEHKGELYFIWSGWREPLVDVETQRIYIARMENPWSLATGRVEISKPEYDWERRYHRHDGTPSDHIVYVNEGPQMLKHGSRLHIIYSGSGCWTPDYCLGVISTDADSDLLDPASWTKHPEPIFKKSPENGVWAPGHNSFFKSPDGTEDWILYHAVSDPSHGCTGKRNPRAQKILWTDDDFPVPGIPLHTDSLLLKPSGL
jgi:GH43 family beta-xylosidase